MGGGGRRRRKRGNPRDRSPPCHRSPHRSPRALDTCRDSLRRSFTPLPGRRHSSSADRAYRKSDREHAVHGKNVRAEHDDGSDFQHNYMLPDHPADLTSNPNPNPNLPLNRAVKDRDWLSLSALTDGQGLLLPKSHFSLPQDIQGHSRNPSALDPSGSMRSDLGVVMHRCHERSRNPYDEKERDQRYYKDGLFSNTMAHVQPWPLVGNSSSLPKDENYLGFNAKHDGIGKLFDEPLKYNGYSQMQLPERLRRNRLSPAAREYDELSWRGRDDPLYTESDNMYRKEQRGSGSEYRDTLGPAFSEFVGEKMDRDDTSRKLCESSFWDLPHSTHGETVLDSGGPRGGREEYVGGSGSGYMTVRMRSPEDHEVAPFEEGYSFERDVAPMAYRKRGRSNRPLLADHNRDMLRYDVSPPQHKIRLVGRLRSPLVDHHMYMHGVSLCRDNSRFDDDLDVYDQSPERMVRRKYVTSDDVNGHHSRGMLSNDRDIHRRLRVQSPDVSDERWSDEEDGRLEPYITSLVAHGPSKCKMPSHIISRNDSQASSGVFDSRAGGSRGMSFKKHLKSGPSDLHVCRTSQRRQVLPRPNKFWKRGLDDRHDDLHTPDEDIPVDGAYSKKSDPPENSEEFKHQVHEAFLRFTKLLNENPHHKKRYEDDQVRTSNLLCCVCGSASKEFVDAHSLLAHTYQSLKSGLRTKHLGFHKALCILMGWNCYVPPDNPKVYMSRCDDEVKALKEDLILWPPVVIINNSSIGNTINAKTSRVISVQAMKGILKGMGFEVAKGRLCVGKPANHSVLLFKFFPTFSGLEEAERLHKYYAENKHGREELKKITSGNGSCGEAPGIKDEELMYGYIAVAEDLDKLDPETKKRCRVKSRKDIEAIADAPLNAD